MNPAATNTMGLVVFALLFLWYDGRNYQGHPRLTEEGPLMPINERKLPKPEILTGWKEIAQYLRKGVRTIQRYERQMGLPIRRPAGKPHAAVLATREELDAWVTASPIRTAFSLSRRDGSPSDTQRGLEEMVRLRNQMMSLRAELQTSVSSLTQSVIDLKVQIHKEHEEKTQFPLGNPDVEKLLALVNTRHRKAS